ncbi:MAG: beta-glucuronidase, partial [Clostridia bacterium]|nr:beta-glucuronidase [Clostridia bacterium]
MRLFDEHIKRKTILLDGVWDFVTDEGNVGINEEWFKEFPKDAIKVTVPGCINNRFGYITFQNTCWYKK